LGGALRSLTYFNCNDQAGSEINRKEGFLSSMDNGWKERTVLE